MRRNLGRAVFVLGAVVTLAVSGGFPGSRAQATDWGAGTGLVSGPEDQRPNEIHGFAIGDERRYIVGPPGVMRDGEEARWSVRLDRIEGEAGSRVGVYEITHEVSRRGLMPTGGILVTWRHEGWLAVNEYGFPESLRFQMYEEHTGESPWRGETMSASYDFEDGEFHKIVEVVDQKWEFPVPIARHGDLDLDVPRGLYLFRPEAVDLHFFNNPALLEFAIPELLPDTWKQRVLFFKPTLPIRHPNGRWAARERNRQVSIDRYYDKITLELGEETQLEIAGRTLNLRRLKVSGPGRDAYVDEVGRVIRMDIEPDPYTRKERYIRLLFPSEY